MARTKHAGDPRQMIPRPPSTETSPVHAPEDPTVREYTGYTGPEARDEFLRQFTALGEYFTPDMLDGWTIAAINDNGRGLFITPDEKQRYRDIKTLATFLMIFTYDKDNRIVWRKLHPSNTFAIKQQLIAKAGGAEELAKYANKEGVYTCIGFQLSRDEIYAWFKHTEDGVKLCLPTINTTATSALSKRLSSYHGKSLKYGQPTHESELLTLSQLTAA